LSLLAFFVEMDNVKELETAIKDPQWCPSLEELDIVSRIKPANMDLLRDACAARRLEDLWKGSGSHYPEFRFSARGSPLCWWS